MPPTRRPAGCQLPSPGAATALNGGSAVGTGNGVPRPPATGFGVRGGTVFVDRPGGIVPECSRAREVGAPVPVVDEPELQDARATATSTSNDRPKRPALRERTGTE